ncbi:MAG TPA: aminomethyl-transferring glycine dehydrogenase subunit GcvPA [Planctomycetota bacterium]|jgi:glycine dehydrogenase subunit 1|nr:aminomethyl-transferring glycine dehydrogenase subunit GcvPA [Planctomycetota bacterium]
MPFIPNTDADRTELLEAIGVKSIGELFENIPAELRLTDELPVPPGVSEDELMREVGELASWNSTPDKGSFLGGGMYRHYIPAVVGALQSRQEFVTAYTPYQPEASQGTLTAFFEFQTMVAELLGMEIANASMYEGCSAVTEAVFMAMSLNAKRGKIVVSAGLHPHTLRTLATTQRWTRLEIVQAPLGSNGRTDLAGLLDEDTCAVVIQSPNFAGVIEDLPTVAGAAADAGALSICSAYPIACGLLQSPGEAGFDVAVGDGQSLGVPVQFGGPSFGLFATRQKFVRKMPGRIVGQTVDHKGRRGFTLTFQTREQHIRRAKATSNICTNNALMALRGAIYLAAAGPEGLREVAEHSLAKAQYAATEIAKIPGFELCFPDAPFFNEFAVRCPVSAQEVNRAIDACGMLGGVDLAAFCPELGENTLLLAFTELTERAQIDRLLRTLSSLSQTVAV